LEFTTVALENENSTSLAWARLNNLFWVSAKKPRLKYAK
jgi:hypothetical protein